ncbi:MAG: hypothetical protein IKO41_04130 [Lachnospiraceae bacterium]|nr:hypothetical protein [Lachnospiraceae bacterium]
MFLGHILKDDKMYEFYTRNLPEEKEEKKKNDTMHKHNKLLGSILANTCILGDPFVQKTKNSN